MLFICPLALFAQPNTAKQEKIEQIKADFIRQRVDFTTAEAQAFWPIYNDYHDKRESIIKSRKEMWRKAKDNVDGITDKEMEALIDNELVLKQKELDLQKEFHKKLKLILSSKKIVKYFLAEEEFRQKLAEIIKQKK